MSSGPLIRSLEPADLPAARALLDAEALRHPYATRPRELLEAAAAQIGERDAEYRALVATEGSTVTGVVLFGLVAGAVGTGTLFGGTVGTRWRHSGTGRALVAAAVAALDASGARVVIVELPDDAPLRDARALLTSAGFVEEARVPDLVRDGVAVSFLRREPGAHRA